MNNGYFTNIVNESLLLLLNQDDNSDVTPISVELLDNNSANLLDNDNSDLLDNV